LPWFYWPSFFSAASGLIIPGITISITAISGNGMIGSNAMMTHPGIPEMTDADILAGTGKKKGKKHLMPILKERKVQERMMKTNAGPNRVCRVSHAGRLDNRLRRWLQNPRKILSPYIKEGMTVLDMGCGPGFFSTELAQMVGKSGRVIAADLQEEMLEKLKDKIQGTELEKRITLYKCEKNKIGLPQKVDLVLAFYMVHEIPNQEEFFKELESILQPGGQVLVVEPPFHVSKAAFTEMIEKAGNAGFKPIKGPKVILSKTVILKKG
jgi:2-polyprenyl-3-methyl-5-hydroxy-6-metoxy-1,4-benzoquinol methylase